MARTRTPRRRLRPDESGLLPAEPTGSNGFAIAPSNSASKHAMLWINPHTSFFFRSEAQMTSDEGLNAYGALTWGQFFIYQGFNEHAGWMHTSSGVDNIDEYLETVTKKGDGYLLPVRQRRASADDAAGSWCPTRRRAGWRSGSSPSTARHHGPIVREVDGKWVSVRLMEEPVKALTQSYTRTKAKNLEEFKEIMELHTNSSNNTVFADAEGNIAYFHANFIPKRDTEVRLDEAGGRQRSGDRVAGRCTPSTRRPNVFNPKSGWLYNTNNWPWTAAGPRQPEAAGLSRVRGAQRREPARRPRDPRAQQEEGLHA